MHCNMVVMKPIIFSKVRKIVLFFLKAQLNKISSLYGLNFSPYADEISSS